MDKNVGVFQLVCWIARPQVVLVDPTRPETRLDPSKAARRGTRWTSANHRPSSFSAAQLNSSKKKKNEKETELLYDVKYFSKEIYFCFFTSLSSEEAELRT